MLKYSLKLKTEFKDRIIILENFLPKFRKLHVQIILLKKKKKTTLKNKYPQQNNS